MGKKNRNPNDGYCGRVAGDWGVIVIRGPEATGPRGTQCDGGHGKLATL